MKKAMKVIDVMGKFNKVLTFPWSITKIEQAGLNPATLMMELGKAVGECEDCKTAQHDIFSLSYAEMEVTS